jgi:hypothetical protein
VRYCIIRHACFLAGLGRPAGDPDAPAQAVEQITSLLRRPVAPAMLEAALRRLEAIPGPVAMPDPGRSWKRTCSTRWRSSSWTQSRRPAPAPRN